MRSFFVVKNEMYFANYKKIEMKRILYLSHMRASSLLAKY